MSILPCWLLSDCSWLLDLFNDEQNRLLLILLFNHLLVFYLLLLFFFLDSLLLLLRPIVELIVTSSLWSVNHCLIITLRIGNVGLNNIICLYFLVFDATYLFDVRVLLR